MAPAAVAYAATWVAAWVLMQAVLGAEGEVGVGAHAGEPFGVASTAVELAGFSTTPGARATATSSFLVVSHLFDEQDWAKEVKTSAQTRRLLIAALNDTATVTASVHANPLWAAARAAGVALARPTSTQGEAAAWQAALQLFEGRSLARQVAYRAIAADVRVAVLIAVPVEPGAGSAAARKAGAPDYWLAAEVYAQHPWLGDDLLRARIAVRNGTADVEPVVAALCERTAATIKQCSAYRAAMAAHVACGLRLRAPATGSWAPGRGEPPRISLRVSVAGPAPACSPLATVGSTGTTHAPAADGGDPTAKTRGRLALPGDTPQARLAAVVSRLCRALHCPSAREEQARTAARHLFLWTVPWFSSDGTPAAYWPSTLLASNLPPDTLLTLHMQRSLLHAEQGLSRLSTEVLQLMGMSAPDTRHLLNNLCSLRGTRYLEVGSFQGSTLLSCLYGNSASVEFALAIDSFVISQPAALRVNIADTVGAATPLLVLHDDAFQVDPVQALAEVAGSAVGINMDGDGGPPRFNVYVYDGDHSERSQYQAFTHYAPVLDEVFLAVVDDWNWVDVKAGTQRALRDLGFQIIADRELGSPHNQDLDTWWNGLYIALVRKGSVR